MAEFGETTVMQTTLASMFPISYTVMRQFLSPRTPQALAPLAPEKVRPLILTPFSLTYSGALKIADLNTELLFLARAICAPTQSVSGGIGVIGGKALLINIVFDNVTVDDVATPLVIQGLTLTGDLFFTGTLTSFGIVHVGYNTIAGSLTFGGGVTVASLEIYECSISGPITLPSGSSLVSILVYGQYPQISIVDLSNPKLYPLLTSLLYLNGVDGMSSRDIPAAARGFGAFTLAGLTQPSYPLITTLAVPDPWSVDLETLFPNLTSLFVINYPTSGSVTVPSTPRSRYTMLTFIGAGQLTALDLTARAASLTSGIRIVGCPLLTGVILRSDPVSTEPLREYRTLVIERCSLIYLRGTRGLSRPPTVLRLGDHSSLTLTMNSRPGGTSRLLDYVLQGLPTFGTGNTVAAVPSDYLPNVIVLLAETLPSLVLYPVMQTVEYLFTRSAAVVASDPSGGLTTTYTQYSGGANPVVPSTGTTLTSAVITVSPFGIRYTLRVTPISSLTSIGSTIAGLTASEIRPATKGSLFAQFTDANTRANGLSTTMIIIAAIGLLLIVGALIAVAIVVARKKRVVQNLANSGPKITQRR